MFLTRDGKEETKKQARSNKQTRQSNTAHPRQSLFLEKMSCLGWDMYMYNIYRGNVEYTHGVGKEGRTGGSITTW